MQVDPQAPLFITGIHRCGTSLVARFLHHAGIDLGKDLLGPANSNRYGHYEDVDILAFHKRVMLREFGCTMWVPAAPHTNGAHHPASVLDSLARRTRSRCYHVPRHNRFLQNWLLYTTLGYDFYVNNESRCLLVTLEAILSAPEAFVDALAGKMDISTDRDDPFPRSVLEAMAGGRSVAVFDVGEAPEALAGNGRLILPVDTDKTAAAILEILARRPEERLRPTLRRRYLAHYTPQAFGERLARTIRDCL